MRAEVIQAFPLLDDQEGVLAEPGLERADAFGIDGRAIFDAAGFGVDRGHVGAEGFQDRFALAGLGGDDGDDMDHGWGPPWVERWHQRVG